MFLVRWKHIMDIDLRRNMVSMRTKDLNQYITSVVAFNSTLFGRNYAFPDRIAAIVPCDGLVT